MIKCNWIFRLIFITVFISQSSFLFSQGLLVDVPIKERIIESDYIVQGLVVKKECKWDISKSGIYTLNYIKVLDDVVGNIGHDTIIVLTNGGVVKLDKQIDFPCLKLNIGDIGLFLVNKSGKFEHLGKKVFSPLFSKLSFVSYDLSEGTAYDEFTHYNNIDNLYTVLQLNGLRPSKGIVEKYVSNKFRNPDAVSISSFSPASSTAGTMSVLTINGSGFGSSQGTGKVEFKNSDNGGSGYMAPIQSEYVSWSDTQIKVEIPSGAGSGTIRVTNNAGESSVSSSDITINYNITNINYNNDKYRTNLVNSDNSGGIEFVFYTDFYNDANARDAFERALGTWRCSNYGGTGVYFADGLSSTVDVIADDGVNIVRFDNGNELPSNVLGRMTSRYSGCSSGGGYYDWYVSELDVAFNDVPGSSSYSWNFSEPDNTTGSNQYDFESVAVHEVGHGHQLGHVIDASQIMHYNISNGDEKRELSSDDLDAGNDVINFSSSICGKPEMDVFVCAVLPLSLLQFDAKPKLDKVELKWKFADVFDLDYAILQGSADGVKFNDINVFEGGDGTGSEFHYQDAPMTKEVYYRLRVFDLDGSYFDSKKLFVHLKKSEGDIGLFPNPFVDNLTIENNTERDVVCDILNTSGVPVLRAVEIKKLNREVVSLKSLPIGLYFLKIKSATGTYYKRIIKK